MAHFKFGEYDVVSPAKDKKGGGKGPQPPQPPGGDNGEIQFEKTKSEKTQVPDFVGDRSEKKTASRISDIKDDTIRVDGDKVKDSGKRLKKAKSKSGRTINKITKKKRNFDKLQKSIKSQVGSSDSPIRKHLSNTANRVLKKLFFKQTIIDWRDILQEFFTQALYNYDENFPNRTHAHSGTYLYYDDVTGLDAIENVVIAVDTSTSITTEQTKIFLNEVMGMPDVVDIENMTIIYTSDEAHTDDRFSPASGEKPDLTKVVSSGGNINGFHPTFEKIEEFGIHPDVLVYMTDGFAEYPDVKEFGISNYVDNIIWFVVRHISTPDDIGELDNDWESLPTFGRYMVYDTSDFFKRKFTVRKQGGGKK